MYFDCAFSIAEVVLINTVLSRDNAMVIAMVVHGLPPAQRKQAMLWGVGLAIAMQLVLTLLVSYLLLLPGLGLLGGVLLAYIACKLIREDAELGEHDRGPAAGVSMRGAIFRIAVADLIMSLDNVVAVAGVSHSDPARLGIGLVLSVIMILTLSTLIMAAMSRFRWILYAGTAVLALTAARMIQDELEFLVPAAPVHSHHANVSDLSGWPLRLLILSVCFTSNRWWPKGSLREGSKVA